MQALWAMAALSRSKQQARREAAAAIISQAAHADSSKPHKALFSQFKHLTDHLVRLCNFQPSSRK